MALFLRFELVHDGCSFPNICIHQREKTMRTKLAIPSGSRKRLNALVRPISGFVLDKDQEQFTLETVEFPASHVR